ncbi:ABC transporter permease (plasmid) [Nocardioides sp. R1-1]|uniref:ABC transporter permease n=1 Tax=Nocardioides sp. R1-1 TaxID=3383502 RepID=UPI0038D0564E
MSLVIISRRPGRPAAVAFLTFIAVAFVIPGEFPAGWRIDVGSRLATWSDSLIEATSGFTDPVGQFVESIYADLVLRLSLVPALEVATAFVGMVLLIAGWRLAGLAVIVVAWLVATGLWSAGLETMVLMALSVLGATVLGVAVGVSCSVVPRIRSLVLGCMVGMQTVPVFLYLIPVVLVFGPGNTAAVFVTLVYSVPPVVTLTDLGLRQVPSDPLEATASMGATRWQALRWTELPIARPQIIAGVNQAVMLAIAMSIIAAMIGAEGLGSPVWSSLGRLEFGRALDAGVALVLIAVLLDRSTASLSELTRRRRGTSATAVSRIGSLSSIRFRSCVALMAVGVAVAAVALSSQLRNLDFSHAPESMRFTFRGHVDAFVDEVNLRAGDFLAGMKDAFVLHVLGPLNQLLADIPWLGVVAGMAWVGSVLLGPSRGLLIAVGLVSIGLVGMWDQAVLTVSAVSVSAAIAIVVGVLLGIAMSAFKAVERAVRPMLDVLQSIPIFLFVLPSVIILGSGPAAGIIATVIYSLAPVARLTALGLKEIDRTVLEAGHSMGASWWQTLRQVRAPLGMPIILTGMSQTILLAFAMSVVSAFIGTPGLGQVILTAVGQADLAAGVEAGYAMLVLALVAASIIQGLTRVAPGARAMPTHERRAV